MGMVFLLYLAVQKLGRRKFETAVKLTDINGTFLSRSSLTYRQTNVQSTIQIAINITRLIWRQKYEKWLRCSFCSSWCICKAIQRVSEDWLLHDPRLLALRASFFLKKLNNIDKILFVQTVEMTLTPNRLLSSRWPWDRQALLLFPSTFFSLLNTFFLLGASALLC